MSAALRARLLCPRRDRRLAGACPLLPRRRRRLLRAAKTQDPCKHRALAQPRGLQEIPEQFSLSALDGAACKLGVSRETLARALAPKSRANASLNATASTTRTGAGDPCRPAAGHRRRRRSRRPEPPARHARCARRSTDPARPGDRTCPRRPVASCETCGSILGPAEPGSCSKNCCPGLRATVGGSDFVALICPASSGSRRRGLQAGVEGAGRASRSCPGAAPAAALQQRDLGPVQLAARSPAPPGRRRLASRARRRLTANRSRVSILWSFCR